MKRLIQLIAVATFGFLYITNSAAHEQSTNTSVPSGLSNNNSTDSLIVYIDPQTGEFIPKPTLAMPLSLTEQEELTPTPGIVTHNEDGSSSLDLRNRKPSFLYGQTDCNGKLKIAHSFPSQKPVCASSIKGIQE